MKMNVLRWLCLLLFYGLHASCLVSFAQGPTDATDSITNSDLLTPFTVTNSAGMVFPDAFLIKLTTTKFFYKTPGGAMGSLPLTALPKDLQLKIVEVERKRVEEIKTKAERGDSIAMVTVGDRFYKEWQWEESNEWYTNKAGLDPNNGLPVGGLLSATNSVNYLGSMEWWQKAAALGNTNAMWRIVANDESSDLVDSDVNAMGPWIDPNTGLPTYTMRKEALRWLKKLAEKGDLTAKKSLSTTNALSFNFSLLSLKSSPISHPDLEFVSLSTKIMEANDSWWRWSYRLTAKNNTLKQIREFPRLLFLDEQGFIVKDVLCEVQLSAGESKVFLGTTLVDLPGAAQVKTIKVELK